MERGVGVTEQQRVARWKPIRAGIRNIWEYDEQVFDFADGRMILRGPNGSGKSNALALTFPFLFDGTMSAAAMDPFAGGRSMKSLLLGVLRDDARSGFRHDQRLGYVWLEFARPGADGDEFITVGCGARARADGDARSWFFLTDRRVGIDLDLAPGNTPLTRGRLAEELGGTAVHEGAEEHRRIVARDVLGIDTDQLGKLNGLIRALRRPQLAGKLNLDELSAVLSSGLPVVAPSTLDDIAASLDDLERVQHELASVRGALATVDAFLPAYRTYLTGEARLRCEAVLTRDRQLLLERRDLARRHKRHAELTERDAALRAQRSETENAQVAAAAERDALKDSARFKDAQALEHEEAHATDLEAASAAARARGVDSAAEAERLGDRATATEQEAAKAETNADRSLRETMDRADGVGATWSLDVDAQTDPGELRPAVDVMVSERRSAIVAVRQANRAFDNARIGYDNAEAARSKADKAVDSASNRRRELEVERDRLRAELEGSVEEWLGAVPGLEAEERAHLAEVVALVADGEVIALGDRYRLATEVYRDGLRDDRAAVTRSIEERERARSEAQLERDLVANEDDSGPAAPLWRTQDRTAEEGAPLWACCDFMDSAELSPGDQAGLEAALEAAGILDAWIRPGGEVGVGLDAWLQPTEAAVDADGATLASVLTVGVPEGSGLDTATVEAVLASVHLGQLGIAVDRDGSFSLGPLFGRATKAQAEFIGAPARAQRRVRRLAELDAALTRIDHELGGLRQELVRFDDALGAWNDAVKAAPDTRPLSDAATVVAAAVGRERNARDLAHDAAEAEAAAAAALDRAGKERDSEAARRGVPVDSEALDAFAAQVDRLASAGNGAVMDRVQAKDLSGRALERRHDADEARGRATRLASEAEAAERSALAQRRRVDTLRQQLGADARSVFDEVAALDLLISGLANTVRSLGGEIEANQAALGEAAGAVTAAEGRIEAADDRLRRSQGRLPALRGREVLSVIEVPTEELPLEPVAFAQWMVDRLGHPDDVDHDQAKKAVDRAQKQLLDDLHQGYAPAIVHDDDLILVEVTSDDRSVFGLAELRARLEHQAAEMAQHLTDSDREIFERHLLNRVSHELRRLLGEADEFVLGVNNALARTKTASGLQVELKWVPTNDDPETRRALELLRRDTDQMGDDDRAALRRFFDLAITRQRAEHPDAGYRGNLEQVVDYRQWHKFQPFLVGPDGRARLTRERFRGLSGGEQAVALHLPLFAAAAAHYDRAAPSAPRLVALDEAFAGIDEAMRGELLGLTVAFDLDVLLTGHELWGAYAEVPAIAVHDLLRRPPLEGVSVLTLRWDGHDLTEGPNVPGEVHSPAAVGLFAGEPNG